MSHPGVGSNERVRATVAATAQAQPVVSVTDLSVTFPSRDGGRLYAVSNVSLTVGEGKILGIVGESGSGKSVTCLAVAGLLGASADLSGTVCFDGETFDGAALRHLPRRRLPSIAMVFQEPFACLNPVRTVGSQIAEAAVTAGASRDEARRETLALLDQVGIPDPEARAAAYPNELSGGLCQRVMIAMALAMRPRLIIADEPTTALDVTVQAQVVALLVRLVRQRGIPMIFISHDLDLVAEVCDRIAVMYAGTIAEVDDTEALYDAPRHPYTRLLLEAMPGHAPPREALADIPGELHLHYAPPRACPFAPRCPRVLPRCREERPVALPTDTTPLACFNPWPRHAD